MLYALISFGSRGDTQPFVALSIGLMAKGHTVTLLANENFRCFVEAHGIGFHPLHGDMEAIARSPQALSLLRSGNIISFLRHIQRMCRKMQPQVNEDMLKGCAHADVLVAPLSFIWAYSIAEKLQQKMAIVQLSVPAVPTMEFPFAGLDFFDSPLYNLFTHRLVRYIYWQLNKKGINGHRRSLVIPALKRSILQEIAHKKILQLYAFSPSLIGRPTDWGGNIGITGFLHLRAKKKDSLPENLMAWLQKGNPPIYIGFGSIPIPDPEGFSAILRALLEKTSHRFIFCRGWSEMPVMPVSDRLFVIDAADHALLFPHCRMAIIHGGIGTIAAALRASLPIVILSIFADQPLWGKIIAKKNLGVHIPFKQLTAEKLIAAIRDASSPAMKQNVLEISAKINREDGVGEAVNKLEGYFAKS